MIIILDQCSLRPRMARIPMPLIDPRLMHHAHLVAIRQRSGRYRILKCRFEATPVRPVSFACLERMVRQALPESDQTFRTTYPPIKRKPRRKAVATTPRGRRFDL